MKFLKYLSVLLALVQTLVFTAGAINYSVSDLPSMEEYNEIKELLPEIIPELNEVLSEEGYNKRIEIVDILLDEGYPIYINENYFSPDIKTPEDLLSLIDKQDHYVWKIPVDVDSQIMLIGLGKGYAVRDEVRKFASEELIAELDENEGKWNLTTIEFVSKEDLYTHKLQDAKINAEQVVFVNGLTGINLQMAICIDNGEFKNVLSLSDAEISYHTNERNSNHVLSFDDGAIYSYKALQESLGMIKDDANNEVLNDANSLTAIGGGTDYYMDTKNQTVALGVAAAVIFLLAAFLIKRKYNRDIY